MHSLSDLLHHLQRLSGPDVRRLPHFARLAWTTFRQGRPGIHRRSLCRLPDHDHQRFRRNQFPHLRVGQRERGMSISGVSDTGTVLPSFTAKCPTGSLVLKVFLRRRSNFKRTTEYFS